MKKILAFILVISMCILTGCSSDNHGAGQIPPEENHMQVENGFYIDVFAESGKDLQRTGEINLMDLNENIFMVIQNAGKVREFAIKVLLDYMETPFVIEGEGYVTYILKVKRICEYRASP